MWLLFICSPNTIRKTTPKIAIVAKIGHDNLRKLSEGHQNPEKQLRRKSVWS